MRTKRTILIGLVTSLWLVFAGEAQVSYNPSTGRWLSRYPLGDHAVLQPRIESPARE